jgi:2'-5' RNA ligase
MIRAFIAMDLPDDVRAAIGAVQERLQRVHTGGKVSWTKLENIHLTLQFLGHVSEDKVAGISAALDKVAGNQTRFAVPVGGVGAFPNVNVPRVLWVGCGDPTGQLGALAAAVRACGGADEEREFAAHLTLGRIKWPRPDAALTRALDSLKDTACGTLAVDAVHLFQSQLHPQGSVYTKLSSHPLKGD